MAVPFAAQALQPGPLNSSLLLVGRIPGGRTALFALAVFASVYGAVIFAGWMWSKNEVLEMPEVIFSLLVLLFFVVEQVGIGGNIPFYDRYVLQVAPFMGVVGFCLTPALTRSRVVLLLTLSAMSHGLLWRYVMS